jgi:putative acetyltransferase
MIRTANLADEGAIAKCVSSAFDNFGEVTLIQQLAADGDKLIELVFEESGTVSGYVLISNLRLQDAPQLRCGAIAPLAVHPDHQLRGIGSELVREAILASRGLGLDVLCLLGDARFYRNFGFRKSHLRSDYNPKHFQHLELTAGCLRDIQAKAVYAPAFSVL